MTVLLGGRIAQSFAAADGDLKRVVLRVRNSATETTPFTVDIAPTVGNTLVPRGEVVLVSTVVPVSGMKTGLDVALEVVYDPGTLALVAGQRYAVTVRRGDDASVTVLGDEGDPCPGTQGCAAAAPPGQFTSLADAFDLAFVVEARKV